MINPTSPLTKELSAVHTSDLKWFSGLAMHAILSQQKNPPESNEEREEIALWAWRMGQAMVATEMRIHADRTLPSR